MSGAFEVYPAIDLRGGHVVRLTEGDPARQKVYGEDPGAAARAWLEAGARWLHVVNLDGALAGGAATAPPANRVALEAILAASRAFPGARVQLGGGLRRLEEVGELLAAGVERVVLGTAAVQDPPLVGACVARFGAARVAVGLDARDGEVRVRGWQEGTGVEVLALGEALRSSGLATLIYTDISRDGRELGPELETARELARRTGLEVIASGGVARLDDLLAVRAAGLAGVIVGRALYEGRFSLQRALEVTA